MGLYLYQALDPKGLTRQGELQAQDKANAMALLMREGFVVISLKEKGEVSRGFLSGTTLFSRVTPLDRILLTRHLSSIIRAGISLGEAVEILISDMQKRPLLKRILEEMKRNLEEGHPLSSVFAAYPEFFPPVFTGMVRAGELSGTLEETLENLGNQLIRDYELVRKVRSAMIYPIILLIASAGVIVLLMTFLLPRMAKAFQGSSVKLPLITQILVDVSSFFAANSIVTISGFIALILFSFWFFRKPSGKRVLLVLFRHFPLMHDLLQKLALSRFCRTMRNLIKSGMPILESLEIVSLSLGNDRYRIEIDGMREELKRGVGISEVFRKREDYFPRLVGSLVTVGERTGSLEKSFETLAIFYDDEVDRALKSLVTLLEPLLLLIMGMVVGGIALAMLLPIYQAVTQLR